MIVKYFIYFREVWEGIPERKKEKEKPSMTKTTEMRNNSEYNFLAGSPDA